MKQLFLFLTPLMFLAFGCTTDNSGNTTVVPLAPTGLTATVVSTTQVKLNWTDNATNETGYKIQRKTGNGNFTDIASTGTDITTHDDLGLTANTSYTYRVYAFNNAGNSIQYSNEVTVNTDGSVPNQSSVTIGTQIWSTKNLSVARYRNGDPIPQVTNPTQWANLTTGAWCWYNNDSASYAATYGRLYNLYAVKDPRGLAPQGWHVPTESEWRTLETFLGGEDVAGGKMKSTIGWVIPNTGATNSSGFSGLPGGRRAYDDGRFFGVGTIGIWWSSSTVSNENNSYYYAYLNYDDSRFNAAGGASSTINPTYRSGISVRLVKD